MTLPREEVDAILTRVDEAVARGVAARTLLGMVRDWADADGTLYDPVEDRYAIRLPGDLVRRIGQLAIDF